MIDHNSILRDRTLYTHVIIPLGIIIPVLVLGMYYGLEKPMEDHWAKVDAEDKAKTLAEHNKLISMNCNELGNWLLQDNVWNHDNLIWAQNHYLVNCKK